MKIIRTKLKGNNGATLVMALIYMLICITIGSMIMSSGSTAAGQVQHLREEEQSYLNVLSAAELIKSEMLDTVIMEENTTATHMDCGIGDSIVQLITYQPANAFTRADIGTRIILKELYKNSSPSEEFTIKATSLGLRDVNVSVSMLDLFNEDYTLKFVLTEADSDYKLTLIMPAEVSFAERTEVTFHDFESSPGINNTCTQTDTVTTTTITYDVGSIYKGAI